MIRERAGVSRSERRGTRAAGLVKILPRNRVTPESLWAYPAARNPKRNPAAPARLVQVKLALAPDHGATPDGAYIALLRSWGAYEAPAGTRLPGNARGPAFIVPLTGGGEALAAWDAMCTRVIGGRGTIGKWDVVPWGLNR